MIVLYGIKNCDTVKKARQWLAQHGVEHRFHDFRVDGLPAALLNDWLQQVEYTALLNRRSRTWKTLSVQQREGLGQENAQQLMQQHPTLIKRPVVDLGKALLIGFSEKQYSSHFASPDLH